MDIAILTRPDDASPKILASSLQCMLKQLGVQGDVFEDGAAVLRRLVPLAAHSRFHARLHFRLRQKMRFWRSDRKFLRRIARYDAVVLSECTPNAFWRGYYDIERLRGFMPGKPVLLYEVYYLGNAPRQIERLQRDGDMGIDRYDFHFAVSSCTEIRSKLAANWAAIGLDLEHANLKPCDKTGFVVVVDFAQPGYERYRQIQFGVCNRLGIQPVVLAGRYALAEIRKVYQQASVFMMSSSEAFGVSTAECLSTGAYIFAGDSAWPMAWRLDEHPQIHGPGTLADVFVTYTSAEDLALKLDLLRKGYQPQRDPYRVFDCFRRNYPHFYKGDLQALETALLGIQR